MKPDPSMRIGQPVSSVAQARLEIGRILLWSLRLLGKSFIPILLILLFFSIPELVFAEFSRPLKLTLGNAGMTLRVAGWVTEGLEILIQTLFFGLGQGAVCFAVARAMDGQRASFPGAVFGAMALFGPLAAVSVLYVTGLVAGLIVLIIPGLVLAMTWFVVIPVCSYERLGIGASFGRSAELTRGHRWSLFGLFFIVQLTIFLAGFLLDRFLPPMGPLDDILSWLIVVVIYAFDAVVIVVTYRELIALKGEGDGKILARVFD